MFTARSSGIVNDKLRCNLKFTRIEETLSCEPRNTLSDGYQDQIEALKELGETES